ncbi:insulinoma-associated protein 1b [Salminus brasiliensis]|uniref:insulinoma-associated protein 1b n=1 Tax=Salminus brasiliensis TaxID=930266 RepID=UPI003B8304DD
MPKGFLVKRNKRAALVSYRIRCDEDAQAASGASSPDIAAASSSLSPSSSPSPPSSSSSPQPPPALPIPPVPPQPLLPPSLSDAPLRARAANPPVQFGNPEAACQPLYSPTRPVSKEHERTRYFERSFNLGSPISAESFPCTPASLTGLDHLLFAPVDLKIGTSRSSRAGSASGAGGTKRPLAEGGAERKSKGGAKKPKAMRKLHFEDEVTTSPVLGLRIKEGPVEPKPRAPGGSSSSSSSSGSGKPLGEFICQLCKEEYADPFSLAQHKCSRIVRVEYRCPECDKVFSCPANLASHRRWHKPRAQAQAGTKGEASKSSAALRALTGPTKEASAELVRERDSFPSTTLPSPPRSPDGFESECGSGSEDGRGAKSFKRHAHKPARADSPDSVASSGEDAPSPSTSPSPTPGQGQGQNQSAPNAVERLLACPVCGESAVGGASLERHVRLLHAAHVFPCKHCPATFYSSPGLTRHVNKCHPTEKRQVVLLHVPVRPAC